MHDPSPNTEALSDAFLAWTVIEKRFLSALLSQLVEDTPSFNGDKFVARLYALQEALNPNSDDEELKRQLTLGLRFLGEFIELAEDVLTPSRNEKFKG